MTRLNNLGDHEQRQNDKRDRLEERAEKAQVISNQRCQTSSDLAHVLPFGQPILVGHHSEARHRRHIEKINTNMRKSVEAQQKADHLSKRAASVGSAGIASDDAQAIEKVRSKLANLESAQTKMKAVNAIIRKKKLTNEEKIAQIAEVCQFSEAKAAELLIPDVMGEIGFARYALSNNNANIRATRKRLEDLEALHNQESLSDTGEIDGLVWELFEDDGRIQFKFDSKPSEAIRTLLKSNAFNCSPSRGYAWVRKITPNAVYATKRLIQTLHSM